LFVLLPSLGYTWVGFEFLRKTLEFYIVNSFIYIVNSSIRVSSKTRGSNSNIWIKFISRFPIEKRCDFFT
jgi:hypothetical protein